MIKQINEVKERAFYLPRQRSHTSAVSRPRKGELAPNISDGEFFREICLRIYHPAALLLSFHPYLDLLKNFFPPNFFVLFRSFLSFFIFCWLCGTNICHVVYTSRINILCVVHVIIVSSFIYLLYIL